MRWALAIVLGVHGLIHGVGFVAGFSLAHLPLRLAVGRVAGALWLATGMLFLAAALLVVPAPRVWWLPAAVGLVVSQYLIVQVWKDAKLGSLVNVALLVPVGLALLAHLPGGFDPRFRAAVAALPPTPAGPVVTEAMLQPLPEPVQRYLRRAGVVGKPGVARVDAEFTGKIRAKADGPWMPFTARQVDVVQPPARYFLLDASMYGVPVEALHVYANGQATMEVRAASVASMADARGPEMNRGETVTFFNDLCVLIPSALAGPGIRWEAIDARFARATYTAFGQTISATLEVDEAGDLVDFHSDDRMQTEDGTQYRALHWSTPLSGHRGYGGLRLAQFGEARWTMPEGPFAYGQFRLERLEVAP